MFYSQLVLAKKGPLGKIWLAAHMEKKVPKLSIIETNIPESVENIETVPMALRVSGHLLLGVVRIFSRKVTYLLTDCSEALVKIKDAFRAPGGVELAPGAGTKSYEEITRHDQLDEMDLDADLTDQQMLFTIEDGIELPGGIEGIELPDADKDDLAPSGFPAQDTGFPGDEKLECLPDFFPEAKRFPTEEEEEEEEDDDEGLGHSAKRRRPSSANEGDEPQIEEEQDDEAEMMRPERLRSHGGDLSGGLDMLVQEGDEPMFSEAFDDGKLPLQEEEEEEDALDCALPNDDPDESALPGLEEEEQEEGGLDTVMGVEGRNRQDSTPVPSPKASMELLKRDKPRPKRKMIIDDETQLSADFLRKQLDDTSSIVRDFKAEAAAAAAKAGKNRRASTSGKTDRHDPLVDAPRLFYLPSNIGTMPCFLPKSQMPRPKRMRVARDDPKDAEEGEEIVEIISQDAPEVLRSASRGSGVSQVGGLASLASDFEDEGQKDEEAPPRDMELDEEEFQMDRFAEEEEPLDEPLPLDDENEAEEAEAEEVEQPSGFNPSLELPNVESTLSTEGVGDSGGSQASAPHGSHDPAAWNPRTRKMYSVLQAAFEKSNGESVSYDAMIKQTRKSADKRKVVAGCFQELLFLTTHGMIELDQKKPYGNILVNKTELFGKPAAA